MILEQGAYNVAVRIGRECEGKDVSIEEALKVGAEKLLEMGFYIGFNGIITYSRDYDKVIKNTPLNRILLETDSPYLTPEPHRGERNEPLHIKYIAEKVAEIKGIKFEEVAKQTTKNAKKLFKI